MNNLPTVELIDRDLYWIKPAYGDLPDAWTVGRWQHGLWWDLRGREVTPKIISGPIPRPDHPAADVSDADEERKP